MPRLGPQRRRVLERVLRENGLVERPERGKGSHRRWEHPEHPTKATTVPDFDVFDVRLVLTLIRQSGKTVEEYLSHLK
jgi:predicted RNA binding protein YcfA (HicA-like mRNA interferase family)